MRLKQSLLVLFLSFSNLKVQDNYFQRTYHNLREKKISYPSRNNLIYFYVKNDYNGEPLYSLAYLHTFDVQAYFKKLQRTP